MNRRAILQAGAAALTTGVVGSNRSVRAEASPSTRPSGCPKLLTGSFIFVQHVNLTDGQYADECLVWRAENWRAILQDMHAIGMDTAIWTNTAFWGRPLFPGYEKTVGLPWRAMGCNDPLGVVAEEADRLGMKIFYGIGFRGRCSQVRDYSGLEKPWPEGWFRWNTAVAEALVDRYGRRPSFGGLYLSYEIDYHELHAELYEKLVKEYLRPAVGRSVKLLASPGNLGREVPDLSVLPKRVERSGVDIIAPQDYGGRGGMDYAKEVTQQNAQALAQVGKALRDMGVAVWANCETFGFESTPDGRSACIAGPMERIRQQIALQAPVADKLICYVYQGVMNRRSPLVNIGAPNSPVLYRDYVQYLKAEFPNRFAELSAAATAPVLISRKSAEAEKDASTLLQLKELYSRTLLDDVVPFWERHGIDVDGGINTCMDDTGKILSRDRWCWSQWRAVWVFSRLYNTIEKRPQWLDIARGIYQFVNRTGRLNDGHWPMVLDPQGKVLKGYESIFTDGFAIYALVELWRATHETGLLDQACATFRATEEALNRSKLPPMFPYPTAPSPDALSHGISMMFSLVYHELARATGDKKIRAAADHHHQRVMNVFLRPQRGVILEWLDSKDQEFPAPTGTVVLPGHGIESLWFQIQIERECNGHGVKERAIPAIRRALEIGWDAEFGGLFYAVDADGRPDVAWPFAETKLWWPHTEALYATLLAYECSREPWCLEWHERLREYSYAHFPVQGHGEWRQKCDRQGRPITTVVALPVKDPFHLPRMLILSVELVDRLIAAGTPKR